MTGNSKQRGHALGKSAEIFAKNREEQTKLEANPHIRGDNTTRKIMGWMILALMPSILGAGYYFGFRVWGLFLVAE